MYECLSEILPVIMKL